MTFKKSCKTTETTKFFFENQIEEIFQDNENNCSELKLSNQEKIKTKFIAGCDGRNSNVAKIAKLNEKKSYISTIFS